MTPVDTPVALVKIGEGGEEDRLIENWLEHKRVVRLLGDELDKVGLHLFHSAVVMTVQGDWARLSQEEPKIDPENDEFDVDADDDADLYEMLIQIRDGDAIYGLYIPLDPFFFVAKRDGRRWVVANQEEAESLLRAEAVAEEVPA